MKFILMAHETHRPGDPPMELFAAIGALGAKNQANGSLIEVGGLAPIQTGGAVVTLAGGAITTVDGPFVETKELVGGYAVYELADVAEAAVKAADFLQTHLDHWPGWEGWVEVRQMFEQPPTPGR